MKTSYLTKSLLSMPSRVIRNLSYSKGVNYPIISIKNLKITTLLPNDYNHFQCFKEILTNENVVFSSSWINKWFGIERLRKRCDFMSKKLEMLDAGDPEISLPEDVLEAHRKGISPTQIALNRFFTIEENRSKLREIYLEMTKKAEQTGLGYYKFEDQYQDLIGGGALAPLSEDAKKVDIALHILKPRQGIGSYCLEKLLEMAFKEKGVEQVWGSSLIDHRATPVICAQHGMIIQNIDGLKYYFMDKQMWEVSKDNVEKVKAYVKSQKSVNSGNQDRDNSR